MCKRTNKYFDFVILCMSSPQSDIRISGLIIVHMESGHYHRFFRCPSFRWHDPFMFSSHSPPTLLLYMTSLEHARRSTWPFAQETGSSWSCSISVYQGFLNLKANLSYNRFPVFMLSGERLGVGPACLLSARMVVFCAFPVGPQMGILPFSTTPRL